VGSAVEFHYDLPLRDGGIKAFTGREWDPEIGLYYYRARYYDPGVARFLSPDPLPELSRPLGRILTVSYVEPYVYADNNPANRVDPAGLLGMSPSRDCSNQGPSCDEYGECENYQGANARCFCRCAGNDPWSSYVRCCLRDMYPKHTPHEAHLLCYIIATVKYLYVPGRDLNRCFFQCSMDQAVRCNTCFMRR
jgi:RHS repeat-associated protein